MTKAGDLLMLIKDIIGEPDDLDDMPYVVLLLSQDEVDSIGVPINESQWQKGTNGLMVRIDPENTNTKTQRHVHVSPSKHINASNKQVAWNLDGSRHDKGNFNAKFGDTTKARDAARAALGLPDELILEDYLGPGGYMLTEASTLVAESVTMPEGALVFVSNAARP